MHFTLVPRESDFRRSPDVKSIMSIKTINLPKSECFPSGKKDVRSSLKGLTSISVEFRHTILKTYRYAHLSFDGHVLANAGIHRQSDSAHLYIFPIKISQYSESARADFIKNVLPKIRSWIDLEFRKSDTEISATQEELFVVWKNNYHTLKLVKFNY